ncbi:MAG: lysine 5,6-aminomutase subunit alpha [Actinomycetota bacterium]
MKKLSLDRGLAREARRLASAAAAPVQRFTEAHTTVSVERAVLRLLGVQGAGRRGIPIVNQVVDRLRAGVGLERGALLPVLRMARALNTDVDGACRAICRGRMPAEPDHSGTDAILRAQGIDAARTALAIIDARRAERDSMIGELGEPTRPWIYLIVATGNIYEDIPQAQAAARAGADVVAVIRSTGQSLMDYVPEGPTTEGFAGTYATQANFRLMRRALDETAREVGRYIRLTNYASGLCMPEIAALASFERLDMMLNDCMYGIIFRDINPYRTFVDQRFSRMLHARAGIIINTGEDNYLTTADAMGAAHTVVASQLLNERFGLEAGLAPWQLGLGHAFEINPQTPNQFVFELAHAMLVRALFPDAPLKYMPPTKHMSGDIFAGFLHNGMFNLAGILTGQDILLLGMMTEGIHTPFLHDRDLALENVRYVRTVAQDLSSQLRVVPGGLIEKRAAEVLSATVAMLRQVGEIGLFEAIARGMFADTPRPPNGGKGLDGVVEKGPGYFNPIEELLLEGVGRRRKPRPDGPAAGNGGGER